jgi:hypothetical protein
MNIIRLNHLDKRLHVISHELLNFYLAGLRVLNSFLESFLVILNSVVESLPIHVLTEELHHAFEAIGHKDPIVTVFHLVPYPAHDVPEPQERLGVIVDVFEVSQCECLVVEHLINYVKVYFKAIFFEQLIQLIRVEGPGTVRVEFVE